MSIIARPKEFDREIALQKAMAMFWAKGYEGTSVDDLIETMNISRSSLYQSFGNKQDLFLEALQYYMASTNKKRSQVFAAAQSAQEGMAAFLQGVIQFLLDPHHPCGCFFTNTATALGTLDQPVHQAITLGSKKLKADFYYFFCQCQERGDLATAKDPHALASFFVGVVRGISVLARIGQDPAELHAIVKIGLEVLK